MSDQRVRFTVLLIFVGTLSVAGWWLAAGVSPVLVNSNDRTAHRQCDTSGNTGSESTKCNTERSSTADTSPPSSFGLAANPFGLLDCRKQDSDPSIRKLCNPSDTEATAISAIERDKSNAHNPSSMEFNISRLIQGTDVTESVLNIILTHQHCQPESIQVASGPIIQEMPECTPARWKDIRSRAETALMHAYGREPSPKSETALGLWRMSTVRQALTEYLAAKETTGFESSPAMIENLRLRLTSEFGKLKSFESSRRFPDNMLKDYILALEGIE